MTSTYSYDYENSGGMDYDQIHAANPGTTAMAPVTRRQTMPTNYPVGTREDNKAVSKSYLEWVFFLNMGGGVMHFLFVFYVDTIQIYMGQYSERMFFFNSNNFF